MFTVGGKNPRSATGDFENQRDRHPDIPVFQNFNLCAKLRENGLKSL